MWRSPVLLWGWPLLQCDFVLQVGTTSLNRETANNREGYDFHNKEGYDFHDFHARTVGVGPGSLSGKLHSPRIRGSNGSINHNKEGRASIRSLFGFFGSFPCFYCGALGYASPEFREGSSPQGTTRPLPSSFCANPPNEPTTSPTNSERTTCQLCQTPCIEEIQSSPNCGCPACECQVCGLEAYEYCCELWFDAGCSDKAKELCDCDSEEACSDTSACPSEMPSEAPIPSSQPSGFPTYARAEPTNSISNVICPASAPTHLESQCLYPNGQGPAEIGSCPVKAMSDRGPSYSTSLSKSELSLFSSFARNYPLFLPFDFYWMGVYKIPKGAPIFLDSWLKGIYISPLDSDLFPDEFAGSCPPPCDNVGLERTFGGPLISIFRMAPLSLVQTEGEVYFTEYDSSVTLSFIDIPWTDGSGSANATVDIFSDGRISICFGGSDKMNGFDFTTGVEDSCLGASFPATDAEFGFDSRGVTEVWPEGYCYCFDPCPQLCGDEDCGSCSSIHDEPGCSCLPCRDLVCSIHSYCCEASSSWDYTCQQTALQNCDCGFGDSGTLPFYSNHICSPEAAAEAESQCELPHDSSGECPARNSFEPIAVGEDGVLSIPVQSPETFVHNVTLPFPFYWMGVYELREGSSIFVSENGMINISPSDAESDTCDRIGMPEPEPHPIFCLLHPINGDFGGPRISMMQNGYDFRAAGEVLVKTSATSLLISFQGAPLNGGTVNFQTELFPDGRVSTCIGGSEGDIYGFGGQGLVPSQFLGSTGVEDPCLDLFIPADDASFGYLHGPDGEGATHVWPEGYCFCYDPCQELQALPGLLLTPSPTSSPTDAPTSPPTGIPSVSPKSPSAETPTSTPSKMSGSNQIATDFPTTLYPTFHPNYSPSKSEKSPKSKSVKQEKQKNDKSDKKMRGLSKN